MDRYLVNRNPQEGGEHEVHTTDCDHLPEPENRIDLGYHDDCEGAIQAAKKYFTHVDGCFYCCEPCHNE